MTHLYWVVDHLGNTISAHETRHEAVGVIAGYHECNDYQIVPVNPLETLMETPKRNRNGVFPA